jgi:DNA-binding transcriptional ArsR family regulator
MCERLAAGPLPVGQLAAQLPVSRPAVSQHLKILKHAGLVVAHQVGNRRVYALDPVGVTVLRGWIDKTAAEQPQEER